MGGLSRRAQGRQGLTRKVSFRFSDAAWADLKGLVGEVLPDDLDAALRLLAEEAITDFHAWRKQGSQETSELHFLALRLYTYARGAGLTYKKSKILLEEILIAALDGEKGSIPSAIRSAVRHHRACRAHLIKQ